MAGKGEKTVIMARWNFKEPLSFLLKFVIYELYSVNWPSTCAAIVLVSSLFPTRRKTHAVHVTPVYNIFVQTSVSNNFVVINSVVIEELVIIVVVIFIYSRGKCFLTTTDSYRRGSICIV